MNTQLIKQGLDEDTRPCVLRLRDGTRVRVAHPDFVALSPGQVVVINPPRSRAKSTRKRSR